MKQAKAMDDKRSKGMRVAIARRRAFIRGAIEGFSGPSMLAKKPDYSKSLVFEVRALSALDEEKSNLDASFSLFKNSIEEAISNVMMKSGLTWSIKLEKELQNDGKLRSVEKLILSANGREKNVQTAEWKPRIDNAAGSSRY